MLLRPLVILSTLVYTLSVQGAVVTAGMPGFGACKVKLDGATVVGNVDGAVSSYLGIPFAQPPVGDLRLRRPKPISRYTGTVQATQLGHQCWAQAPQFASNIPDELFGNIMPLASLLGGNPFVVQDEDCLNLNVIAPTNAGPYSRYPVVVFFYPGGFAGGSNAILDAEPVVRRSIEMGQPIIYVAMNYRLHVFGFLGGKEVKNAGVTNLGLHDQRLALQWVKKYIPAFGGDPNKVTLWGQSAGAISVSLHMLYNNGNTEGLYRAAWMQSGAPPPTGSVTNQQLQDNFYFVANEVGCGDAADKLACMRKVSAEALMNAANKTPSVIGFQGDQTPYVPRADGDFIKDWPQKLVSSGRMANIPVVIGNVKDEGTIFSIGSLNISTDQQFEQYTSDIFFPGSKVKDLKSVIDLYPSSPAAGSPYGTRQAYQYSPQFKRISALQGDWLFQAPRRHLVNTFANRNTIYSYQATDDSLPGIGVAHGTDLFNIYGPGSMTDYLVRFVNTMNPNGPWAVQWPRYNTYTRQILEFSTNPDSKNVCLGTDNYRLDAMQAVINAGIKFPM